MIKEMRERHHGTEKVMNGKLKGLTDTDYFNFLCPDCNEIMQFCDYLIHKYSKNDEESILTKLDEKFKEKMPKGPININIKLYCHNCKYYDYIKISNIGFLEGKTH